ncbi:MAG: ankyrin repeat domain-containing protein, partial [Treponemataceae bacterium]|nr:ankyrin repeat domain-containing protein [Treponemataceae bacterium]
MNKNKRKLAALAAVVFGFCAVSAHADAKSDALVQAELNNNVAEAKRLIAAGADVNAMGVFGFLAYTPLMIAADKNSTDVAKVLIEAGVDVNAKDFDGNASLYYAASKNSADVAKVLIEAG